MHTDKESRDIWYLVTQNLEREDDARFNDGCTEEAQLVNITPPNKALTNTADFCGDFVETCIINPQIDETNLSMAG